MSCLASKTGLDLKRSQKGTQKGPALDGLLLKWEKEALLKRRTMRVGSWQAPEIS
jgi:hypothetical protein